jgi:hypothetical protein
MTILNLLRVSRLNSHLSAEAQLNGAFHFNQTPLAPLEPKSSLTKIPLSVEPGHPMELTDGTLALLLTITAVE